MHPGNAGHPAVCFVKQNAGEDLRHKSRRTRQVVWRESYSDDTCCLSKGNGGETSNLYMEQCQIGGEPLEFSRARSDPLSFIFPGRLQESGRAIAGVSGMIIHLALAQSSFFVIGGCAFYPILKRDLSFREVQNSAY